MTDRWSELTARTLLYWRQRATELYLRDVVDVNKKGEHTAGTKQAIEIGSRTLRAIGRELTRRDREWT